MLWFQFLPCDHCAFFADKKQISQINHFSAQENDGIFHSFNQIKDLREPSVNRSIFAWRFDKESKN